MTTLTKREEALLNSLRILTQWAQGGDKDKNPYSYPHVKQALITIAEFRGLKWDGNNSEWMDANNGDIVDLTGRLMR